MFWDSFRTQVYFILRQRITQIVFGVLLIFVSINYIDNVLTFHGMDMTNLYHPMKMLSLSYNKTYYNAEMALLIVQIYPLLVVCPAGLSYAKEKQLGMNVLMEARIGGVNYKMTKLLAVFCTTVLIFTVPFLIEILLNSIAFPLSAMGDFSNLDIYDSEYIQWVNSYTYSGLYEFSSVLYASILTIVFGILSGVLAMGASAFAMVFPMKYRVFYLLPVFIVLNSTVYFLPTISKSDTVVTWYSYFLLFNDQHKNINGFVFVQLILICLALISAYVSGRKDCIL